MGSKAIIGTLCVRADSSVAMGFGHVMRCLALAQAWREQGGVVTVVTRAPAPNIVERFRREGVDLHLLQSAPASLDDAIETCAVARTAHADWIAVDGYHFDAAFCRSLRAAGTPLLMIDDLAQHDLANADVILNQNAYATPELYEHSASGRRLLLGTTYALLRREFAVAEHGKRAISPGRHLLLTFGGSDAVNATERMLNVVVDTIAERLRITIVAGAANPHVRSLEAAARRACARHEVEVLVDPPDLPACMAAADLAISASGSTALELAALGVPMALVITAENHRRVSECLAAMGAAVSLGDMAGAFLPEAGARIAQILGSPVERTSLASAARRCVDGRGARRTIEALGTHPIELRPANATDTRDIWEWANDPVTRAASFKTEPIVWETHIAWFEKLLGDPLGQRAFIAMAAGGETVGFVRFTLSEADSAELSLNVAPAVRGRGLGALLIRLSAFHAADSGFCRTVRARVRSSNARSLAAFHRAGFTRSFPSDPDVVELAWEPLRRITLFRDED